MAKVPSPNTNLRRVEYIDNFGRKFVTLLPEGLPDSQAHFGILVGPPPLDDLKLPLDLEVRLNNKLFERNLLTPEDIRKRRNELHAALNSALNITVEKIANLYNGIREDQD